MPAALFSFRVLSAELLLAGFLASAPVHAESFQMDLLETDDFRLLYFDPFQTYLTPLVASTFYNSLQFQRRVFEWTPYEKSTLVLTDLADYGNAGASASPRNGVTLYIAPASHTLETLPGSERMYSTMNHEAVHLANMDAANTRDLRWRRLFGGKPRQTDEHPESILYNYLTVPRLTTPRWYLEGAASFMETWMAGGVGRAQGAYDEMVFRAMVRDGAHFYSNLGLVSKGVIADFQTGTNAYLYGTRFFSYLAYVHSPQDVVEWLKRGEDSEAYYSDQFAKVFGEPLETAWNGWIAWEHEFQTANLQSVREHPLTQGQRLIRQGLGSVSRSYYEPATNTLVGAFQYPGVVAYAGVVSLGDDSIRKLVDIKGPMKYRVTSTAFDPATRTLFYAADNSAWRDLMSVDVATGKSRMLLRDARIGDICFDESDRSLWGLRHLNGYVTLVHIPYPYTSWAQVHTWPYGDEPFELDVSADGSMLSMSIGQLDGSQFLRVFRRADLEAGNVTPMAQFDFGKAIPEGFVFTRDGRYLYGSSYFTGVSNIFRYELATGELEAVSNAETGFFRPIPMADGRLIVQEYTGDGFAPMIIDPKPLEDVSAITFLGAQIAKKHPIVREWVVGSPAGVDLESMITRRGKYKPMHELASRRQLSHHRGLSRFDCARLACALRRPGAIPPARHVRELLAGPGPALGREAARQPALPDAGLALGVLAQRRGFLRPVRPDQAQPQGRRVRRRIRQGADLRRSAAARPENRGRVFQRPRHLAGQPERPVRVQRNHLGQGVARLHRHAPFTGIRGPREGLPLGTRHQPRSRRRRQRAEVPRQLRFRLCASAREFVRVALQLGRRRRRRPGQPAGELLFRRLRQQLCG